MTQFSFTADYDGYGQARQQLSAAMPRGWEPTLASAAGALVSYSQSQHAGYDEQAGRHSHAVYGGPHDEQPLVGAGDHGHKFARV